MAADAHDTVWFDTSGTGRLMFVMLVLLALCAWELAHSLVWYFWDRATDACIACAPSLEGTREIAANAHDAHGLV